MYTMFKFILTRVDGAGANPSNITVIVVDCSVSFTSFAGSSRAGVIKGERLLKGPESPSIVIQPI